MKKTTNLIFKTPLLITAVAFISMGAACGHRPSGQVDSKPKEVLSPLSTPNFVSDSAYYYIQKQVEFGPRVPNTPAHEACAQWLTAKMQSFGAQVEVQEGKVTAFDNTVLQIKNIIAQFQPEKNDRILLFAHWDTRPFADHDLDIARPIPQRNELDLALAAQQDHTTGDANLRSDFLAGTGSLLPFPVIYGLSTLCCGEVRQLFD